MKFLLSLLFASGLFAQSLIVTPDQPQASAGSVTVLMVGPASECPPFAEFAQLCQGGYQTVLVVVLGATSAQIQLSYTLNGQQFVMNGPCFAIGPNCSNEFIIDGGAEVDQAEVALIGSANKGGRK